MRWFAFWRGVDGVIFGLRCTRGCLGVMLLRVENGDPPRAGMELLIWLTSRCPRAISCV
jgi:hypothetical protein